MEMRLYKSKGYAFFLAILPIVMMYKVPVIGLGVSTTLIAIGMAYAAIVIIKNSPSIKWELIIAFIIYLFYVITKSNIVNALICIAIGLHFIAISTGALDTDALKEYIKIISVAAAVGVVLQFIIHLLFSRHLPLIASGLILDDMDYYVQAITTGVGRNSTMYRPSAFFIEPAHMTMYCVVALCGCLIKQTPDYKSAVIISVGVLATTSGMGIVLTATIWIIFPFFTMKKLNIRSLGRIVGICLLLVIAIIILMRMPFFQSALARITGPVAYSSTQYNAIWGRTAKWGEYITPLTGNDLWFGKGISAIPDNAYFTGFMTLIYCYGIVGTSLMYIGLIILLIKCKNTPFRIVIIIYGVMLYLADIAGMINVIFYIGMVIAVSYDEMEKRLWLEGCEMSQ